MNSAAYNNGKRIWFAVGQESHCQLYNIQTKVISLENGEILNKNSLANNDGLRKRRKSEKTNENFHNREPVEDIKGENKSTKHKKLQFVIQPADSIQTDFGYEQMKPNFIFALLFKNLYVN